MIAGCYGSPVTSALSEGINNVIKTIKRRAYGDLYVGGRFWGAGDTSASYFAKWNGTSWSAVVGMGAVGGVTALAVIGSNLYAAGSFALANGSGSSHVIAKWSGTEWSPLGSGIVGRINAIAVSGTDLYVVGYFTSAGALSVKHIAKWDSTKSDDTGWSDVGAGVFSEANALAILGSDVYVGGNWSGGIRKWNGTSWSSLGSGVGWRVHALAFAGTNLYVGGEFTSAGGNSAIKYLAKWDTTKSDDTGWSGLGSGVSGDGTWDRVTALVVSGSDLYVGGTFTSAGGTTVANIAKWDTTKSDDSGWSALGAGVADGESSTTIVNVLAISGSDLYVGGGFTAAGGDSNIKYIAKWNGSSWSAVGSGTKFAVSAILNSSMFYVGGGAGVAQWSTNLVAKAASMSATSDSAGVQLAYISAVNNTPYYMTYNGTSWGAASQLSTNPVYGPISLATKSDSSQWVVAWERGGQIEYRNYSSSAWGSVTVASTGYENRFPSLPERIGSSVIPILWTKGSSGPYQLGSVDLMSDWRDVTTMAGGSASNCTADPARCTMQNISTGLWWSKIQPAATWYDAVPYCQGLNHNGQTGWRLPTDVELQGAYNRGISATESANFVSNFNQRFWSSVSTNADGAWSVNLAAGYTLNGNKNYTRQVVCVR